MYWPIRRSYPAWLLGVLLLVILNSGIASQAHAELSASVTIDSPADGAVLNGGITRLSGTYENSYEIKLFINGEKQVDVVMNDPDGNDSGTWHYDLDGSSYNGALQITARGLAIDTRYGVWSPTLQLTVNNPAGSLPSVIIQSPGDGTSVNGIVPVRITAAGNQTIQAVQVRINHGSWLNASWDGTAYVYEWDTAGLGDRTMSIEAKATDTAGRTGFSSTTYAKAGLGTNEPVTLPMQDRAMWIWESETYKLLLNPNSRLVLDALAKDTDTFNSDPITTLYLAVGPYGGMDILEDDPGKLRDFVAWAHQQGYQVHACIAGGTSPPYMGAYAAYHDKAIREIERIINYNLFAAEQERFDGVNVDIEPYISQDFKTQYPSLQVQYLDGLKKMIDRIRVAGISLPFGPAIPKWYDSSPTAESITWNGSTKWLSEHIQDISDYISIMDYRDSADGTAGIIAGAQGEIDYARAIGKPRSVVIGVETKDIANSGDPETITFNEEGRTFMEAELDKVYAAFRADASFGGIAMHHYDDIRKFPSYWGEGGVFWQPPADTEPPGPVSQPPTAAALDFQQVRISFGMAMDNYEVDRYVVYRGTTSGFTPGAGNVAGLARSLSFVDTGLLPNTTYYYKVAAMDMKGNIGPVSAAASATTGSTALKPMILTGMKVSQGSGNASVRMQAIDKQTGQPIAGAQVEGRFHYAGGTYHGAVTDASGWVTFGSESIPAGHQVGFEPRRVNANGYYWAQAYDQPHMTALYPRVGLNGLTVSVGTLQPAFSNRQTSYTLQVPSQATSLQLTPTASTAESLITVNGAVVSSGGSSPAISLQEGETTVSILVAGRKGETDVYTVKVVRSTQVDNVFAPAADTYVYQNDPTANYGSATMLEVIDIPSTLGGGDRMAYMKFDLTAFTEPVQSAKLSFYVHEASTLPTDVSIYSMEGDNWEEGSMNWNNRINSSPVKLGQVTFAAPGWYSFDVTAFVQSQMLTDKKITLRFMDPNTRNKKLVIGSREHAGYEPKLVVNPSANADLRSLSVSHGALTPVFDKSVSEYEVKVPMAVHAVLITPETDEPHATVTVNGTAVVSGAASTPVPLQPGANTIPLTVTAQNGSTKSYTLHITRLQEQRFTVTEDTYVYENAASQAYGNLPVLEVADIPRPSGGGDKLAYMKFDLTPMTEDVFSARMHFYVKEALSSGVGLAVHGFADDSWQESSLSWSSRPLAAAEPLGSVSVAAPGWYSLDITDFVRSQMAADRTVTLRLSDPLTRNAPVHISSREGGGDYAPYMLLNSNDTAELAALSISHGTLSPSFRRDVVTYSATVADSVYAVSVTAVPLDPGAQVMVNGTNVAGGQPSAPIPLQGGDNSVSVQVTARNGDSKTYNVRVHRLLPGNTGLHSLSLLEAPLSPAFETNRTGYEATVTNQVYAVHVLAVPEDPLATVTVNGLTAGSSAAHALPLQVGLNEITMIVTSQNGSTRAYTIAVTRLASAEAGLSSLTLSHGSLTPIFQRDVLSYEASVMNSVYAVTVHPVAIDPSAKVEVNGAALVAGETSGAIPLHVGPNGIRIQVTAPDGVTVRTYEVKIFRQAPAVHESPGNSDSEGGHGAAGPVSGGRPVGPSGLPVVRTPSSDGSMVDAYVLDQAAASQVLSAAGSTASPLAKLRLDTDASGHADAYELTLKPGFVSELVKKEATLEIAVSRVTMQLSTDTLRGLEKQEGDVFIRIKPLSGLTEGKEAARRALDATALPQGASGRAEIAGGPMIIESNITGAKTKLSFPLSKSSPKHTFAVYIEHSDGEKVLKHGKILLGESGAPDRLEIEIDKFSTFTVLRLPAEGAKDPSLAPYVQGYDDGTFRPEQHLTRAELASLLYGLLQDKAASEAGKAHSSLVSPYADVDSDAWAHTAILQLTERNIFEGCAPDRFCPETKVTRAELAVIAARWSGVEPEDRKPEFADASGHWAARWIAAGVEQAWFEGYPSSLFLPDREVTRAEAVTALNRILKRQPAEGALQPTWKDVPQGHWAFGHIEAASRGTR
ncbi:cadherin-like beta sandwich domain-containing protein [Paenibacillus silviterrae]|uniref:cadherin-like beta sandwich domain-containing protein n=1 Tax=Paenibacillus silviterrae TaxID=3242194 RepID=UPI002543E7B6|nr:cadherin-like beta sandwich domain-containing protein [Paenibacillus chinjuensis]